MKPTVLSYVERCVSVCHGIANSNWYYWVVMCLSLFMVFTAANHWHNDAYGKFVWDMLIAFTLFFGNRFRVVRKCVDVRYLDITKKQ
jgi:hypothetical protein